MSGKSISLALSLAAAINLFVKPTTISAQPWDVPFVPVTVKELDSYNGPGHSADYGRKVVVSQSGRIYFTGQSTEVGQQANLFIRCFQADGALVWQDLRPINGFMAHDLFVDANDNAFVVGRVYSTSGLAPSHDVGVMKYTAAGVSARDSVYELDYIEPLINPFFSQNIPTAAALAPNGKVYISGYVSDELFAKPTAVSHPYLFAVNPAGLMSLDWTSDIHEALTLATVFQEVPASIAVNSANEAFEVSTHGVAKKGVTLRKITASGQNAWPDSVRIAEFAGRHHEAIHVGLDANGTVYVTGLVQRHSGEEPEMFVTKHNPTDGAVVWAKVFAFGEQNYPRAAKVLPDGSIVGVGSVDYDSEGSVFRINNQGQLVWEQRFGRDSAHDLAIDPSGNIYVVGFDMGNEVAVAKFTSSGQMLWTKVLPNAQSLADKNKMPPSIALDATGAAYVTAHRNIAMSPPDQFGATYPIYDAVLFKVEGPSIDPPLVRFLTPVEGQAIFETAPFPKITVEAKSPAGIQKIAIYDRHGQLRAMLNEPPYEVTLSANADLTLLPLYAVAYDNAGYAGVAKVSTVLEIPDYTIQMTESSLRISEGQAFVRLVAKRTKLIGQAEVTATLTPGSASQNDFNYEGAHQPFTIYFLDGQDTADCLIAIEKDTQVEQDETFTVTLSNPTAGRLGSVNSTTVTIVDDDSATSNKYGAFGFSAWDYHVTESKGAVQVTVVRSEGTEGPAWVNYYTQPNTAGSGLDFFETRGTLHFASGQSSNTITLYVLKDTKAESPESFYVSLDQPGNGASLGAKWYSLVHIQDENPPQGETFVKWAQTVFSAQEQTNPAISGNLADPDNDGFPNLIEYALGLNPKIASNKKILQPEVVQVNGQPALQITFTRPQGRNDLDYIFEAVEKIGSQPCTVCADINVTGNADGTENVRVRVAGSLGDAKHMFLIFKIGKK